MQVSLAITGNLGHARRSRQAGLASVENGYLVLAGCKLHKMAAGKPASADNEDTHA